MRVTVQLAGRPRGPFSRIRATLRDWRASRRATREWRQAMNVRVTVTRID
jgi:hypothetical protein